MAKRIKQTNIDETSNIVDSVLEDKTQHNASQEVSPSQPQKELLEQIDQLKKQNVKLLEEKSKMTDIIANYIAEADQHKEDIAKLVEKTDALQAKLDDVNSKDVQNVAEELESKIASLETEISSLKAANAELSKQNDSCLEKISELTFDNAKLTSMLQEKQESVVDAPARRQPVVDPYNPYRNNGYSNWN